MQFKFPIVFAAASLAVSSAQAASDAKVLFAFESSANGYYPNSGLFPSQGAYYATASHGGAFGNGNIFKLIPPSDTVPRWTQEVLYDFPQDGFLGRNPGGSLAIASDSTIYGTASGGENDSGVVFKLTPPLSGTGKWTYSRLYSFPSYNAGSNGVTLGPKGVLFGGTIRGQAYQLVPPTQTGGQWSYEMIAKFSYKDYIYGSFWRQSDGSYIGSSWYTIFRLSRQGASWKADLIKTTEEPHHFSSLTQKEAGSLFGSELENYGVCPCTQDLFRLTAPSSGQTDWRLETIYKFTSGGFGASYAFNDDKAFAAVIGSKFGCGQPNTDCGILVGLAPPASGETSWTSTTLHIFGATGDGAIPVGPIVYRSSGYVFGLTLAGGEPGSSRAVFYRVRTP